MFKLSNHTSKITNSFKLHSFQSFGKAINFLNFYHKNMIKSFSNHHVPNDPKLETLAKGALVQYHRWYQVYEIPFTEKTINNQKDILIEDVEIVSANGTSKGKAGLEDRLKPFTGWKNAHHVQNTKVDYFITKDKKVDQSILALEADIIYQGIRLDKSTHTYKLHYKTQLKLKGEGELPEFTHVNLTPSGTIEGKF